MKVTCPRSSPLTSASSSLPVPASGHATLPPPVHCILWKRWPARQVLPHRRDDGPVIQFLDRRMLSVRQETAWNFEMGVGSGRPRMARSGRRPLVEQAARSIPKCRWMSSEERTPESSQLVGILTFGQRSDSVQFPISKFQNDANLGRQLGTFAARSVVGRPRQALRRRVERCSGRRKRGPKIQQQDQEMFSCSPVRESWMMNCWWS